MALIECPECGGKLSDKAPACIHCGYPLQVVTEPETKYCSYCGKENPVESMFCGYCGQSFVLSKEIVESNADNNVDEGLDIMEYRYSIDLPNNSIKLQQEQIVQQQRRIEEEKRRYDAQPKCPRCGSVSLSAGKQGFGVGKAVAGAVLLGGVGILAGGIGANKTIITCLNCGYKFKL